MANETTTTNIPPDEIEVKKSRYAMLLLYPDNERHQEVINALHSDRRAVGVFHDRDVKADESEWLESDYVVDGVHYKKPHFHFVFKVENATTLGGFQRRFPDIEGKFIEFGKHKSERMAIRYLLHLDHPEKAPYKRDELLGNTQLAMKHVNTIENQGDDMALILEFIMSCDTYVRVSDVLHYVRDTNTLAIWIKLQSTFMQCIREHNQEITQSPTLASQLRKEI